MSRSSGTPSLLFVNSDTGCEAGGQSTLPPLFLFFIVFFWRTCETDFFFSSKLYETTLFLWGVFETDFSG